jgi:acetyl-CoA carboxylase carboxyl transferase subunit beta
MTPFFRKKKDIPLGLWMKCPDCSKMVFTKTVEQNQNVCPECGFHLKLTAEHRIALLVDEESFEQIGGELEPQDVLRFTDKDSYETKLKKNQAKSGATEAVLGGRARLDGHPLNICAMDFGFMGGSMGVIVGERIARVAEDALERRVPLVVIATSGGARMHEGALSLMQMAKTSAVIGRLRAANVPYITILADPCTGGVSASFAAQGDITLAEPGALIGFAGPRVIQGTIKRTLPEGFQRSEFLLDKGYVDRIVPRAKLKGELTMILAYLRRDEPIGDTAGDAADDTAGDAADDTAGGTAGDTAGDTAGASAETAAPEEEEGAEVVAAKRDTASASGPAGAPPDDDPASGD